MEYLSLTTIESSACPGVRFQVRRLSLGRRMELIRALREASAQLDFRRAGSTVEDAAETAQILTDVDAVYIRWGLASIENLTIDGEPATTATLLAAGPDALTREVVDAIKREIFLSEEDRKN